MSVRVAVVVPCYNDGRFLPQAIQSVRDQEPSELVVVDDGSDDGHTLSVLGELRDEGLKVVTQTNQGLSAARMAGVAATSAPYVHTLDADDCLAAGALTRLADALDAAPGARAAWGDLRTFGLDECVIPGARRLDPWRITYLAEVPANVLLRRSAILEVGGWDMGSGYEDWDFWMKAAERGWDTRYVPGVALHYREHPTPRMAASSRTRHRELTTRLRARNRALFDARPLSRRRAQARLGVKVGWRIVERLPRVDDLDRERLLILVRDAFEPWTRNHCAPPLLPRLARHVVGHRRRPGRAAAPPGPPS